MWIYSGNFIRMPLCRCVRIGFLTWCISLQPELTAYRPKSPKISLPWPLSRGFWDFFFYYNGIMKLTRFKQLDKVCVLNENRAHADLYIIRSHSTTFKLHC